MQGDKFRGDWLKAIYSFIKQSIIIMNKIRRVIQGNAFVLSDLQLFSQRINNSNLDGILAKAYGQQRDIRFRSSFFFYKDLESTPVIGGEGSTWDVILVMFEEFLQSVEHIKVLIKGISFSLISTETPLIILLDNFIEHTSSNSFFTQYFGIESLQGENTLWWSINDGRVEPTISLAGFSHLPLFMDNTRHRTVEEMQEMLPLWMIDLPGSML
jgi:Ni,Fe-hydrogenase III large subunit